MNNTVKVESRNRMLSKAKICGVDDSGSPGKDAFYVQFNPNEISISEACASLYETKNNDLKVNPVENTSSQHVLHLSTTLFYNTYTNLSATTYVDVRDYIRQLYLYTNASIKNKDNLKKIAFMWGSISVIGVWRKWMYAIRCFHQMEHRFVEKFQYLLQVIIMESRVKQSAQKQVQK